MMKLQKKTKRNLLIGSILSIASILSAFLYFTNKKIDSVPNPLFSLDQIASNQPIDLKISTDLSLLLDPNIEEFYQNADCIFSKGETIIHSGEIELKKRGVTRKKICSVPPIMLKFGSGKKKVKLKVVLPCKDGENFQQLIYKEYLAYQIYNQLTDYSFKTQLVRIELEDIEDVHPPIVVDGFLIEEDKCTASRMKASLMPNHEKLKFIDQESYRLFTMFQYCIGNTDWNLNLRHNIKLICKKDSKTPIPVPYDFDYSGFVNAPYAVPHHNMPIKNVKERHFMWRGKNKDGFDNVITLFENKKKPILNLIKDSVFLNEKEKSEVLNYLKEFYRHLEDENILAVK